MKYLIIGGLIAILGWGALYAQPLDQKDMLIMATMDYSYVIKERHLKKRGFEKHGEMIATIEGKRIKFNQYFHDQGFLSIVTHPRKRMKHISLLIPSASIH